MSISTPDTDSITAVTVAGLARQALDRIGVELPASSTQTLAARSPIDGSTLFDVPAVSAAEVDGIIEAAHAAFQTWRVTPAPVRGALVKRLGELLTEHKEALADLVQVEVGKIRSEALGEVQEMIDICDLAVGLSRQLFGKTMPSERAGHRLQETWHPLGVVGVISAFNFPVAVWSWNAAIALVCGNAVVWKPSELTPLTALACTRLARQAAQESGAPDGLFGLIVGDRAVGERLVDSPLVPLVSATGSTRMGRQVGPRVAERFGKSLLELGGNNAAIVAPSADLAVAVNSIVFAAAGTAGQRCTSCRRLIVHSSLAEEVVARVQAAYDRLPIGDPREEGVLVGPLIHEGAFDTMQRALADAQHQGGQIVTGGERVEVDGGAGGYYVKPALVRMPGQSEIVTTETFAPILYVIEYEDLDEAIRLQNAVPQGLSAGIFTNDQREAERYLAADGADCGIVNVNVGTSGAEIGGAFGGEKETGGGRESGSDAWRAYMRRTTTTINYSGTIQLAQGVDFSA
ncbi:MAG: aldehyde dehydrogenase family protein [Actinomycetales bacterium]